MMMKLTDYTIPQQKAITSSGTNIIVSAGAGSGKTQVLTERVLYFIKEKNYKLDNFLILTFTNLAAGEMKERIRERLLKEGIDEANNVDIADITTFDAYALSMVKKHHFNLGISPNISIVDSNVISVRKRTILNEIFEEYYANEDTVFVDMVKEFCFKDDDELVKLALNFYDKSMQKLDYEEYWNEFHNYYSIKNLDEIKSGLLTLFLNDVDKIKPYIAKLPDACLKKADPRVYQDVVYEMFSPLFLCESYENMLELLNQTYSFPTIPRGSSEDEKKYNDKVKKMLANIVNKYASLPKTEEEFSKYLERNIPYANKISEICKKLDLKINEYKKKHEVYEFNDIAKMSLELLEKYSDIRDEIRTKLKMIMIDEYQDTSIIQEKFISYIENKNVYMVGDVKQSIYRFRNARSDIFTNKYNKYKSGDGGIAIDLNKNFRSRKEVLDDINYIFKQIMTDDFGGANYHKDHVIEYGNLNYRKAGDNLANNNLEFLVYEKVGSNEQAQKEASLIAVDIIDKINSGYLVFDKIDDKLTLRKCRFSDFCILMDRGTKFDEYLKVFNSYQIPIYAEQDENIKDNQMTMVMTNILKLIKAVLNNDYKSTGYKKALISVARSFVYSYNDQKLYEIAKNNLFKNNEVINQLRDIICRKSYLSIAMLFEEIIYELDIYHKIIKLGNVRKNEIYINTFLELFKTMSKLDYSLDDFIMYMSYINDYNMKLTLPSQSQDIDSVRIMNIHKSKGLEFNITYFSGLTSKFNQKDLDENLGVSEKYGMFFPAKNPNDFNIFKELNKLTEKEEDLSEKIRLFYVALTRAREKMIFLYPQDEISQLDNNRVMNYEVYSEISNQFNLFQNAKITLVDFIQFIDKHNFELDKDFSVLEFEEQKQYSDVLDVIVDKGNSHLDVSKVTSFKEFLDCVYNYPKFNKKTIDLSKTRFLNISEKKLKYKNLELNKIDIISNEIFIQRASKKISLDAKKTNIDFGNELHLLMEVTDFKNPDFSLIDNNLYAEIIERFVNSELMKNVLNGEVYKEYEFYDSDNNLHGIIDLMIIYDSYIDIIDYKTKNISDEEYINQLLSYKEYAKKVFNKPINCYLYSLLTGENKEVKEE